MLGEVAKALEAYDTFIQILPNKTPAHYLRKSLLLLQLGKVQEAQEVQFSL